jgi:dTDP-4-dehydrorhamnose 3,5-epimerase
MIFTPTALAGVWQIDLELRTDPRGHFARSFCAEEFAAHDLPTGFVQCNVSFNRRRGTLRGLHWQAEPHPEGKLVRCTSGAIFDVAVDLRQGSPTQLRWVGIELAARNGRALYIPPGFAHGFQTLADESEVFYQMTAAYHGELSRGARWDDPTFGIGWPLLPGEMSDRDKAWPDFAP